jgi:hypothetical protein
MGKSHKRDREDEDPEDRERRREAKKAEKVRSTRCIGFMFDALVPDDFILLLSKFVIDGQITRLFQ